MFLVHLSVYIYTYHEEEMAVSAEKFSDGDRGSASVDGRVM